MSTFKRWSLGAVAGRLLLASMDLPYFVNFDGVMMVDGTVTDHHFSIGYEYDFDKYLKNDVDRDALVLSRYSQHGGLMYCKGMYSARFFVKDTYMNAETVYRILVANTIKTIRAHGVKIQFPQTPETMAYFTVDGKKIAGVSLPIPTSINGTKSMFYFINVDHMQDVSSLYKNKRMTDITSLADSGLLGNVCEEFISNVCLRLRVDIANYDSSGDNAELTRLVKLHNNSDWINKGLRTDGIH